MNYPIGKRVIVRTNRAGVFYATLSEFDAQTRISELKDCRSIHYWEGACSLSQLAEEGTKKYQEAEAAEQKLAKAVTYVGFEPDDEPRITYFGADGFILIWHGHEVYDWLSLLSGDNSICREQLKFNEDYGK